MNIFFLTVYFVFVGSFAVYVLYFIFSLVMEEIKTMRDKIFLAFKDRFDPKLKSDYETYFTGKFAYYDKLPSQLKVKFLLRVRKFVRAKSFEGRNDLVVSEEMKAMISAAAVQLTFGLEHYVLGRFSRIIIYPEEYYSPVTGLYHMGEANPKGVVVISWKNYREGYSIPGDTFNVGLHEMAHALELEEILGEDYDLYFSTYYPKWKKIAEEEYENVRDGGESFFRRYAGTNRREFFAVCVEHFFEASETFRSKLPEVYRNLCILLNQDPLSNDTALIGMKHKTPDEMRDDALSSPELFVTKNSFSQLFLLIVFFTGINAFVILSANRIVPGFFIISALLTILWSVPFFFLLKRVVVYEKYIGIRTQRGKLIAIFSFEDIVSVSVGNGNGNAIRILTLHSGKVFRNEYSYLSKRGDTAELVKLLSEKNVVIT